MDVLVGDDDILVVLPVVVLEDHAPGALGPFKKHMNPDSGPQNGLQGRQFLQTRWSIGGWISRRSSRPRITPKTDAAIRGAQIALTDV